MSEPLKPIGFWSYTRDDDTRSRGRLSQLRTLLAEELQGKLGRAETVRIFQDAAAIPYGARWERQINAALEDCSFFIPIVTPGFLQSEWCCKELARFRARQAALGRDDLIFPLHYIDVDDVTPDRAGEVYDRAAWECIRQQQMIDFRDLRFEQPDSSVAVARLLDALAQAIRAALRRAVVPAAPSGQEASAGPATQAPPQIAGIAAAAGPAAAVPVPPAADHAAPDAPAIPPAQPSPPTGQSQAGAAVAKRSEASGPPDGPTRQRAWRRPMAVLAAVLAVSLTVALLLPVLYGDGWRWFGPPAPSPAVSQHGAEGAIPPAQALPPPPPSPPQTVPMPIAPATATIPAAPAPAVAEASPKPGSVIRDCPTCPEMVLIPSGRFTMGVPPGEDEHDGFPSTYDDDARPVHTVTIAHAFYLGKFAITRGDFAAFVAKSGPRPAGACWTFEPGKDGKWSYAPRADRNWQNPGFAQTDRDPVVCVSAQDADAYVHWLSQETHQQYGLPSEAEWEYAARAVTTTGPTPARYWGDDFEHEAACRFANVADETLRLKMNATPDKIRFFSCDDGHLHTSPVGSFQPNAFGLYDMLGNVWQWTADCYVIGYSGAPGDGSVRTASDCRRVLRGGSWNNNPRNVRAGVRNNNDRGNRSVWAGFRLSRTP